MAGGSDYHKGTNSIGPSLLEPLGKIKQCQYKIIYNISSIGYDISLSVSIHLSIKDTVLSSQGSPFSVITNFNNNPSEHYNLRRCGLKIGLY